MDISSMTIREIDDVFSRGLPSEAFLSACEHDGRAGVRRALSRFMREKKERTRVDALYEYEYAAQNDGARYVAGVDEAGRGPLAGPVVTAAVILPPGLFIPGLNDSKKVTQKNRELLYEKILEKATAVCCVVVDHDTIDRLNILQATIGGMKEAILSLDPRPQKVLVDAVRLDGLPMPTLPIIRGDSKSASIAAASIVAKVTRDRLMREYDEAYPQYGFSRNKGYGTSEHLDALKRYGPSPIHRRSFDPIKTMV